MLKRHTRVKIRRRIRSRKKRVSAVGEVANKQLDRHLFRRWQNIIDSRRFIGAWLGLVLILIVAVVFQTQALGKFYLVAKPVAGGVYSEGMVGEFTNANPLFVSNNVDAAVSRLLFSSLLKYDENNELVGDLAASWVVDDRNVVYTVRLKPELVWHDGAPLTADDVLFTYQLIQKPDVKSPLMTGWRDVKIEKVNRTTIRFTLPSPFGPFPHALTNGIVPKHKLQDIPDAQLRSAAFNTKTPVGSGPFVWKGVNVFGSNPESQQQIVQLLHFNKYHFGVPAIDGFSISTFPDTASLIEALKSRKVQAAAGLDAGLMAEDSYTNTSYPLTSSNMLFLRTDHAILSDTKVRQALVQATNVADITRFLGYPVVPVRGPLLRSHIGYDPSITQLSFSAAEASANLTAAGWNVVPGQEFRSKEGKVLDIKLVAESTPENSEIANAIQKQWAAVGVKLSVDLKDSKDFVQSNVLAHNYDVLLYAINLGPDSDVFPYWHSSQAEVGKLNLSKYKNKTADLALEGGRTRTDPALRTAKYKPFLEAWRSDAPAIGLYQPRYLYVSNQTIYGITERVLNTPADRLNDVHLWKVNTQKQPN